MADLVLSASSVEAYRSCGWRWWLQYIEADRGETSIEAAVGIAVHAAVEHYYKARLAGEVPPLTEVLDVFDLTFYLETAHTATPDLPKWRQIGRRVTKSYIEDVGERTDPLLVEQAVATTINGIEYSAHIDLATRLRAVLDLKVKKAKPRAPSRYLFALTGYALSFRSLTGERETDVGLDVMIRLKRDRPYLVPIRYGGPISDRDAGIFARQLEEVANGITAGRFEPTGLETGECKWCPVRPSCVYYAEFAAATGESDAVTPPPDD